MTAPLWLLALAALALLTVTAAWGRKVRADESPAARRERARDAVMRAADDDDHTCQVCGTVVAVRELVLCYDDAALACVPCADRLKSRVSARTTMEGKA